MIKADFVKKEELHFFFLLKSMVFFPFPYRLYMLIKLILRKRTAPRFSFKLCISIVSLEGTQFLK